MGDWQQQPEIHREPVIDYSVLRKEIVTRFMNCKFLEFANEDIALGYRAALGDVLEYLGDECQHESDGIGYTSAAPSIVEGYIYKCTKCGEFYR